MFWIILAIVICMNENTTTGTIEKVCDGDTVYVKTAAGDSLKVGLYGVDAPEKNQEFGKDSSEFVSKYSLGKEVLLNKISVDLYGRTVGVIFVMGSEKSLNEILLEKGMAWHYTAYDRIYKREFTEKENEAKNKMIGLWKFENPVPPWEFRKEK